LVWVDDCLCIGPEKACKQALADMKSRFDCDDVGELAEYVGCKVTHNKGARTIKFTQPVMIQSFLDELDITDDMRKPPNTPDEPGTVLMSVQPVDYAPEKVQRYCRRGVGKLLHMMRWSRREIYNSVRELSRSMKGDSFLHVKALYRVMAYVCSTPKRGYFLNPKDKWDGNPNSYKFRISGEADAYFAKDPLTRRSVSDNVARLEEVPVIVKSVMQKLVAISVTESELYSRVTCAQDMMYLWRLCRSAGISIELPMILKIDNKGTVDTANNWSCGGRMRHVKLNFLRERKEAGIIKTIWFQGWSNPVEILTKNLSGPDFSKHGKMLYGDDEYKAVKMKESVGPQYIK